MQKTVHIVGILNVTPDSYFDGGKYTQVEAAVLQAEILLEQGADSIDIGGESTGPGSKDVPEAEELARVLPILLAIRKKFPEAKISVDTYKSVVAKAALEAGASMINDVTAGRGDVAMFSVIAASSAKYVMMFAKDDTARTTSANALYTNIVQDVSQFLQERKAAALQAGIQPSQIIVDPGLGHFVSSYPKYSFEILRNIAALQQAVQSPVYVSPSRKSFLAGTENLAPQDRLPGTIVASAMAAKNGATYIRTHDVVAVRRGIEIIQEL